MYLNPYNPPLHEADRSRVWSGIKSLDPDADVNYDDEYFDLMHTTDRKLTLRDAMNLQRNRLEGTDFKPQDQMELDGKGIPEKGSLMKSINTRFRIRMLWKPIFSN